MSETANMHNDFFISYANADQQRAVEIAFELEAAGYQVITQIGYFRPKSNCKR